MKMEKIMGVDSEIKLSYLYKGMDLGLTLAKNMILMRELKVAVRQ